MSEEIQIIVGQTPPNFEAIRAVFPGAAGEGVIFAYGFQIFNPCGEKMPPELLEHELAHCERQIEMGVELWWQRYLADPDFRYDEELIAHKAELRNLHERFPARPDRRRALTHIAKKLAAPLYGRMVTVEQAKKALSA